MKKQSEMDASCWRKEKTLDASNAEGSSVSEDGAGGGTRTPTMSPSADFESATSTNSITPAGATIIICDAGSICKQNFSKKGSGALRWSLSQCKITRSAD